MRYGIDIAMAVDQVASVWIVRLRANEIRCARDPEKPRPISSNLCSPEIAVQTALESFGLESMSIMNVRSGSLPIIAS